MNELTFTRMTLQPVDQNVVYSIEIFTDLAFNFKGGEICYFL